MRGPVGSLARPETAGGFEAFDAGAGVTLYIELALLDEACAGTISFQFGLLGRCTALVEASAT